MRRHDLERAIPEVEAVLKERYAKQRSLVQKLLALVGALVLAVVAVLIISRYLQGKKVRSVRTQLAADLHDELGASLHSVGLLADLAEKHRADDSRIVTLLADIRTETKTSAEAVRRCSEVMQGHGDFGTLLEDMRRLADRVGCDLEHDLKTEGFPASRSPSPRVLEDTFLFYKECLINILRHANATSFTSLVEVSENSVRLVIEDNGRGIDGKIPRSLRRRARLIGGRASVNEAANGGTRIELTYTY